MSDGAGRSAVRAQLRGQRDDIAAAVRTALDTGIAARLDGILSGQPPAAVAVFWPLQGEPDLRDWYRKLAGAGLQLALPVVIRPRQPLVFRAWDGSPPAARDALNIPCPAAAAPLAPDMILSPCVGFDAQCYRLGSGGGYYDRTLAVLADRPTLVGVAYECLRLDGIKPRAHDVPMDMIVTEERIYKRPAGSGHEGGPASPGPCR